MAATAVGVALGALLAGPVATAVSPPGTAPVAQHHYVVRPGDTLWSIARTLAPGSDPRPMVDAIASANGVEAGALIPGSTLVLPAGG